MRIFPLSYHGFYPLIFLTSTSFVDTKAKYGISLSRYTAFLYNCPLGYDPKDLDFFICAEGGRPMVAPAKYTLHSRKDVL